MISISYNIVLSSSYVTVFFSTIFFKQHFTLLAMLSHIPLHLGKAGGLKFHIIFLELLYCCASSSVKLEPISLKIDIGVPLLLKNRVNPLMHVYALSKGTNFKQLPRVEKHVNKNISKLRMFYFLRIYFVCTRVLYNQYM